MTKKKQYLVLISGALAHFGLFVLAFAFSFSMGMERFDRGGEAGVLEKAVEILTELLAFPMLQLWKVMDVSILPNAVEWFLVVGNSVLWGAAGLGVARLLSHRR